MQHNPVSDRHITTNDQFTPPGGIRAIVGYMQHRAILYVATVTDPDAINITTGY